MSVEDLARRVNAYIVEWEDWSRAERASRPGVARWIAQRLREERIVDGED